MPKVVCQEAWAVVLNVPHVLWLHLLHAIRRLIISWGKPSLRISCCNRWTDAGATWAKWRTLCLNLQPTTQGWHASVVYVIQTMFVAAGVCPSHAHGGAGLQGHRWHSSGVVLQRLHGAHNEHAFKADGIRVQDFSVNSGKTNARTQAN